MAKNVLITGSAQGIGRAIARELAQNGYNIIINYLSSQEKAQPPAAVQPAKEEKAASAEVVPEKKAQPQDGNWYLQLGAFGVKSNAEFRNPISEK